MNHGPSSIRFRHRQRVGFTLIEILLSVVAFGLVLAAINGVFYGALRLRNTTTEQIEKHLPLRFALPILRRDLANIVPPGGTPLSGEFRTELTVMATASGANAPEFYTATGTLDPASPWSRVRRVTYALMPSTNQLGVLDLYRVVQHNLLSQNQELPDYQWLLGGVRSLTFSYLNETVWADTWDSTTEETPLPAAFKVSLQMEPESPGQQWPDPIELIVPVLFPGSTNETQTATAAEGASEEGGDA